MGKGQSKSYDFTAGDTVKKRSGSKKSNGVEARTSKTIDPDSVISSPSTKPENGNSKPINRTSLPITKEEPKKETSVNAEDKFGAVNGEQITSDTKQSDKSDEIDITPDVETTDFVTPRNSAIVISEEKTNKPEISEEGTEKAEESKEETSKSEPTEQGPSQEEDLQKEVEKEVEDTQKETEESTENQQDAEESQKEAKELTKNQEETEESEEQDTKEEKTEGGTEETTELKTEEVPSETITQQDSLEEAPQQDITKEANQDTTEEAPPEEATQDTTEEAPPKEATQDTTEEAPPNTLDEPALTATEETHLEQQVEEDTSKEEKVPDKEDEEPEKEAEEPDKELGETVHIATLSVGEEQQEDPTEDMANTVSAVVCNESDLKDGDMKEFDLGDGKVLIVREGSEFHALGPKCTHYGAPLVNGSHCNGKIRCPWHGACFSVKTGDIEDFPGLDSIPKFKVDVTDGKVKVTADKSTLAVPKVQRAMCRATKPSDKKVLIIGGGPSSVMCAETLRQEGFTGEITIATQESNIPYDRPILSKAMDKKADQLALRSADFYAKADIDILKQKQATAVDITNKTVTFQDGSTESYTSLVLATGGRPRVLPVPGIDLQNVFQLRTPEDANQIAEKASGKNIVIIGSSFIGMEVASSLAGTAATVSVVDIIKVPFQLVLGEKVGSVLQKMHEDNGVKFYFERGIKEFVGSDGKVTEAVLSDDTRLPADLCVMGVGVVPATDFIKGSGIEMSNRGFLSVDKMMQTNQPDVYATGDIVEFPLFSVGDNKVNIQHWQMAHAHGKTAALGILGRDEPIKSVPYFWTVQYKKSIRYTGYGPGYDDIIVHGDLDAPKFIAYYTKGDEVVAAASLNFDPFVSRIADMMLAGEKILKSEVQSSADGWVSRFEKLSVKA
ncbi:apoptosis-inducing factor 3-like isoform X1 [Ostrea edulis]|uniref:apoptosis-inducing factor 3-like isoform X1 n=1 Tax=Ostrea edulis TaxID=37623 RepID=UPI0024AEDF0B|nr:apoptosis-inducing factor 3-like isoform X1 [Ostrea edulis]XP_056003872.1 apoptosis-inducing factor 3-like isoform X1 [Ostrea edulis]XP_056003880.1 apoptosis-inducing factor 3-like isoform X1 [Ostrea edulis]XP_056003890.1 apoptosis-inducing factor 3-like isoform X1 [Ostrea edulis]XP_056003902.1 apoptosis-inducing factor 3-like isoform X1 [Ostrea edulis]XP_056003912.1 apoptosis-inducing factor 3-like isoform X1 [Ostrea edulis]XP_056003921.1 apoptosis-inducing factor 3-like isoform X1 [Ostre